MPFLNNLNDAQKEAVTYDTKALEILAPPGSGKTRVLTTRVAWLVKEKKIFPGSIVVVTFTNKAANEMKERLEKPNLLGTRETGYLRMGTFHSFCAKMLRRHVDLTSLDKNFLIADTSASKKIVSDVMNELTDQLSPSARKCKPDMFYSIISKQKNKGYTDITYKETYSDDFQKKDTILIFSEYEKKLFDLNLVDFDGLQLHARDLFKNHPQVLEFIEHVLVDEFQDTNALQYELLGQMTNNSKKSITVVGDPDQSIFGWRNADTRLFKRLQLEYENTVVVNLKENYRSTKMIISGASHVVKKDKDRLDREMFTNNDSGAPISVLKVKKDVEEAETVAEEIKRIIKYSRGLIKYKDIAILFRMNFLTFNFEQSFNNAHIPYVLVSGVRFLDRMEIKDIISYLSFFYNPKDSISFDRIINVPRRGLGDVSLKEISRISRDNKWNTLETIQNIIDNHPFTLSARIQSRGSSSLKKFMSLYKSVKKLIDDQEPVSSMLKLIVESIKYYDHLKENYENEYDTKVANVDELITFAHRQELSHQTVTEDSQNDKLGNFLELVSLCGDSKETEDASEGRVSLITMHAAKGLEWPCVFISACEEGIMPMSRAESIQEESRVMYVGMTRAKCFLYCTHAGLRQKWGSFDKPMISRFLYDLPDGSFQKRTPIWNAESRRWVSNVLNEPVLEDDDEDVKEWIDNGDEFASNDDNESDYDGYEEDESLLNYDYHNRYSFGKQKSKNTNYGSSLSTQLSSFANNITNNKKRQFENFQPSSQVPIKHESPSISSSILPHKRQIKNQPLSTIKQEPLLSIKQKTLLSIKQEMIDDTSFLLPIKPEPKDDDSSLLSLKCEQKKQKIQHKTTANKSTKKTKTSTLNINECVNSGIRKIGLNKGTFDLNDVITAIKKELDIHQHTLSTDKIATMSKQKLELLIDTGSLCKTSAKGEVARYHVIE